MRRPTYVSNNENNYFSRSRADLPLTVLTIILLTIGVIMVLSASYTRALYSESTNHNSYYYFFKQLIFAIVGLVAMFVASKIPMIVYKKLSFLLMLAAVITLALVPFIGVEEGGAKRWLSLGFTNFQPSEVAKLALILYFATLISRYDKKMKTFKFGIMPFAVIIFVIVALLVLEPHFSASIIIIAVGATMIFVGGARLGWFFLGFAVVAAGLAVAIKFFPYATNRIVVWQDPFKFADGRGYQIVQSLYAIGSGGLTGLGLGGSRQKQLYLPEEHNDFIFAVVCEELGFIGATVILVFFAMLIIRGYWLALQMRDKYNFLVVTGIITLLAIQTILNVAVVTNLVPCTGISLPFFSYGGTALVMQLTEVGIVLSAARENPKDLTD